MARKAGNVEVHLQVPKDMWERWQAHKEKLYNGLNAMAKMIRDYVNEGIARQEKLDKRGNQKSNHTEKGEVT